ncbi:MAG: protein-disulfide reductase DsbD [Lysobacteraceae bacterium]
MIRCHASSGLRSRLAVIACATFAFLLLVLAASPARAVDESDLLPVDQAFALSPKVVDRGKIEFTWAIAKGYYLYRERISVMPVDAAFKSNPLQLPDGIHKHDPFFGDVQIYHDRVTATLTGAAASDANAVDFIVKYQGCADLGVCYPPQKRTLHLALPATGATTSSSGGIDALPVTTTSTNPFAPHGENATTLNGADTLPLPPEQAFGFDALVDTPNGLLLRFTPTKGYYLYRDRTSITLASANDAVHPGQPQWPMAKQYHDEHFGDVAVYFDEADVPLPLLRKNTGAQQITLDVVMQGCQIDGICYAPMRRSVSLNLPAGGAIASAAQMKAATTPILGKPAAVAAQTPNTASRIGLLTALLLAIGGGLILNLMPCVLPVLSLKALSLVQSGESRGKARRHALWYTAGVMLSFAALGGIAIGLRQAGLALGWGFQLQQPLVIAALAYLMLAVGLALSGVYQFGAGMTGIGQRLTEKSGHAGDFFTGVLAVVVASPCTAPFMGSALAYAFASSTAMAIAVFLALGLGLALPFLLIGFVPTLASRLPKPGAWMETLKQVLAFPMYLTAAWMVSILAAQRGADAVLYVLIGSVALALGVWLWERGRYSTRQHTVRAIALLALLAAALPLAAIQRLPAQAARAAESGTVAYSAAKLAELRAQGKVVFVDITADWCITCKANEKAVLARPAFVGAMDKAGAVYMIGDYTDVDQPITDFLAIHHAVGIPLYVVYPRGGGEGEVLPNILTQSIVDDALVRATK